MERRRSGPTTRPPGARGRCAWGAVASLLLLAAADPARASLGGRFDSVTGDRQHLRAKMASSAVAGRTVQTLTLPNGGVVREYADAQGMVFAVTWRGPGRPDLRQLLGDSFDTLQADTARPALPRSRRPLAVNRSKLIVQTGGHPGGFWGAAYLPEHAPAGFTLKDLD